MEQGLRRTSGVLLAVFAAGAMAGCGSAGGGQPIPHRLVADRAPAQVRHVDFETEVWPLLQTHCISCHGRTHRESGLRLDTRAWALAGGKSGKVIVVGDSSKSKLMSRLTGSELGIQMPPSGALTVEEVGTLRAWIDQGLDWVHEVPAPPPPTGTPKAAALFAHLRRGDRDDVAKLLGDDPSLLGARDAIGATPLMYAALYGDEAMMHQLVERGADVNANADNGGTALHWCVPNVGKARIVLDAGANVNARSRTGKTSLMVAARARNADAAVSFLLERRADPKARDNFGASALTYAAAGGNSAVIRLLLDRGADVNESASGLSPLSVAVSAGAEGSVDLLLAAGADPNVKRVYPAIGSAAATGNMTMVKALLARGANPNAPDLAGVTPLMLAAYSDLADVEIVRVLLRAGANAAVRSKDGLTALSMAKRRGETGIVRELLQAGATE